MNLDEPLDVTEHLNLAGLSVVGSGTLLQA
jgi:hypothetical protein